MKKFLLYAIALFLPIYAQACPTTSLTFKDASGSTQVLCFGGSVGNYIPQYQILDAAGTNALTVTSAGAAKVDGSATTQPIMGTVTANAGTNLNTSALALDTSVNGLLLSQASTTSGQKGPLFLGAVTTSAPSYTTAQSNPLSLTTVGNLRVDGSSVTQPVNGTVNITSVPAGGNIIGKVDILGNAGAILDAAGQNATSPANELLVGGQFNTSPGTISSGNMSPLQLDNAGNLLVNIKAGAAAGGTSSTFGATFPSTGTAIGAKNGANMVNLAADGSNNLNVNCQAGCSAVAPITPIVSSTVESSHVLKASSGSLYSVYATTGATAGFIMTFNATSAPADGAVTPIECVQAPSNSTSSISLGSGPADSYSTGIVVVFSTTGCFTKTASASAFFKARVQ